MVWSDDDGHFCSDTCKKSFDRPPLSMFEIQYYQHSIQSLYARMRVDRDILKYTEQVMAYAKSNGELKNDSSALLGDLKYELQRLKKNEKKLLRIISKMDKELKKLRPIEAHR